MEKNKKKKQPKSKLIIKPKVNINASKAKAKVDFKLGDKLNAQIQGYGKTKSLVKGPNKLQGSKVSGKLEVQRGRHALEGKGEYRPDTKDICRAPAGALQISSRIIYTTSNTGT